MNAFERAVSLQMDVPPVQGMPVSEEGIFRGHVPEGWSQGRGAFGGLVLGYLVNAIEASDADTERRLRSFSGDILSAVKPGPVTVRVEDLRRGKYQSNVQATLEQDGQIVATASAVRSSARPDALATFAPSPPELLEMPVIPVGPPLGPAFAQHYEFRSSGPYPLSAAKEAISEGYVAEVGERTSWDAAALTALLDSWWPAVLTQLTSLRPMATIAFTAQYLKDARALPADAKFRFRARTVAGRDGFFVEMRELWSGGELVAMNQQTLVILR